MRIFRKKFVLGFFVPVLYFFVHFSSTMAAEETRIVGAFNGCNYGKAYELANGMLLVCRGYSYSYSYSPRVIVIDASTVLIGENQYSAVIRSGSILRTNVSGTFEGCNFGVYISFDNGLVFACQSYNYHYAYRPDVEIVWVDGAYTVYIDNEKYDGTLYRQ